MRCSGSFTSRYHPKGENTNCFADRIPSPVAAVSNRQPRSSQQSAVTNRRIEVRTLPIREVDGTGPGGYLYFVIYRNEAVSSIMNTKLSEPEAVRETVRAGYRQIAQTGSTRRQSGGCCGGSTGLDSDRLAATIGYTPEELEALPEGANLGLSCGNPNALAALQPGETVLDLGSGGGFDVFIAGRKVGPAGRAIGVDMTPEMLTKARQNIASYRRDTGLDNVEFRLGEIEHLPVGDSAVDAVISNCVINLSPDKPQVWRELARVLRPGGRVAVSDLALLKPLPPAIAEMVEALIGCIAGAVLVSETRQMAEAAGLVDITLNPKSIYIDQMVDGQDPLYRKIIAHLPAGTNPGDYITSLEIQARKHGGDCCGDDCCQNEAVPAPAAA
jgi:arsenite methyltransferase